MKTNILLTGANGLLGSEFKRCLSPEHAYFCGRDELDVTKLDSVRSFLKNKRVDYIVNCAANCNAEYLEENPEVSAEINELAPVNLAIAANEIGATLIHFSSDYVFDGKKSSPYTEEDVTNPLSVYGKSKERSEQELLNICDSVLIFRIAWLFSEYGRDFVKTMRGLASRGELKVIFDQVGSPSYAGDIARYITNIIPHIDHGMKEIYHLTNEGVCSWYDLSCYIIREFNLKCNIIPIHTAEYHQKAKRPQYSVLDKSKIKRDFDLDIRHFSDGLHECINRIKAQ